MVGSTWPGSLVVIAVTGDDAKCIIVVHKKFGDWINEKTLIFCLIKIG